MLKLNDDIFKYNQDTWERLASKILNGKIILFVGAGLSHGSGMPDWKGLIKHLCDVCDGISFNEEQFAAERSRYLQQCANEIEQKLSKEQLVAAVSDLIRNPTSPRNYDIQKRLIKLIYSHGGVIITTNYDCFLETAADEKVGHQTHAYPYTKEKGNNPNNQPLLDILNLRGEDHESALNRQLHVFKLHGDINSTELVLSDTSYQQAYYTNGSYTNGILNELYQQDILFLGCSLSDDYFSSDWRGQQAKGEWFVLYPTNHSQQDIETALASEKNRTANPINQQISTLNIHAIYYTIDDMSETNQHTERLSTFLSTLETAKSLKEPKKIRRVSDLTDAENDKTVEALQFCPWKHDEEYLKALLEPCKFSALKSRIKRVVFSHDYPNEDILAGMFKGWNNLNEVQLCPNIKRIQSESFYGCTALQRIYTFNDEREDNYYHNRLENISVIGDGAFYQCKALEYIEFSECADLTKISTGVFEQCDHLQKINLSPFLKELGPRCFRDCSNLKTINWVDLKKIKSIEQEAFTNCRNLGQVILPESLTKLGSGAFQDVKRAYLTGLDACALETISDRAFQNCDGITYACFSNMVKTISQWAMAECDKLKTVIIPSSVTKIDANAFTSCSKLENVIFMSDAKIEIADNAFAHCSSVHQEEINKIVAAHRIKESIV